jgi:signal transduction histidine kinase
MRRTELNRMLEELLQFARPLAPVRAPAPLDGILQEVAAGLGQDADLAVTVRAEPVTAPVDRALVYRALLNLAINASQATGGKGRVELACRRDGDRAELTVADDGPGVPDDVLERMFEPFVTTKVRGTGLGLAIARQAVEAHGGAIAYRRSAEPASWSACRWSSGAQLSDSGSSSRNGSIRASNSVPSSRRIV